jgi:hypothetical protein
MPKKRMKKRVSAVPANKSFTYNIHCSFDFQFTFLQRQVCHSDDGDIGDMVPKDSVLASLAKEIEEYLIQSYSVDNVEVHTHCDDLLGIDEE